LSVSGLSNSQNTLFELSSSQSAYSPARVAVLPVPYDGTATYRKGSRAGPAAILEASQQVEDFDQDTGVLLSDIGIHLLNPVEPEADPVLMADTVSVAASRIINDGKFLVTLGGDHAVATAGCCKAVKQRWNDVAAVVVDAHLDLRDEYQGSRFNHACTSRRLLDLDIPVLHLGVRSWSLEEEIFVRENSFSPITAEDIRSGKIGPAKITKRLPEQVYLSIDLDGLDPCVVPSVGTPEPGGLTWSFMVDFLAMLFEEKQVVAADIVELAPIHGDIRGDFTAARLLAKLLSFKFRQLSRFPSLGD